MTKNKITFYLTFLSLLMSIFFNYSLGFLILVLATFYRIFLFKDDNLFSRLDPILIFYIISAAFPYITPNSNANDYFLIVIMPFLAYSLTSSISIDLNNNRIKLYFCFFLFIYSALLIFRDSAGNFTISLSENIFAGQRMIDDTNFTNEEKRFFKNATNISPWLLTFFIFSLCFYEIKKRFIYLIPVILSIFFIFLSNTRSAIFIVLLILVIDRFFIGKTTKLRNFLILILLINVFILLIPFFIELNLIGGFQMDRFYELFDDKSSFGLGQREFFWAFTVNEISKDFIGYGHSYIYSKIGYTAHNDYLGQIVSVGIISSILYFIFIIKQFLKNMSRTNGFTNKQVFWNKVSFYMSLTYLIISFTEQVSYANKLWITLLFMILGISNRKLIINNKKNQ